MVAALIWCGVTRRARSTALPLLILVAISLIPTEVGADSITYNVVNYPALQNGYTVSGTITTNGAIGTALPSTDIMSWETRTQKVKAPADPADEGLVILILAPLRDGIQSLCPNQRLRGPATSASCDGLVTPGIAPGRLGHRPSDDPRTGSCTYPCTVG